MNIQQVRQAYDLVAHEYRRRIGPELDGKPFDRQWLTDFVQLSAERRAQRLADQLAGKAAPASAGQLLEVGCGDGHIAAFLWPLAQAAGLEVLASAAVLKSFGITNATLTHRQWSPRRSACMSWQLRRVSHRCHALHSQPPESL